MTICHFDNMEYLNQKKLKRLANNDKTRLTPVCIKTLHGKVITTCQSAEYLIETLCDWGVSEVYIAGYQGKKLSGQEIVLREDGFYSP